MYRSFGLFSLRRCVRARRSTRSPAIALPLFLFAGQPEQVRLTRQAQEGIRKQIVPRRNSSANTPVSVSFCLPVSLVRKALDPLDPFLALSSYLIRPRCARQAVFSGFYTIRLFRGMPWHCHGSTHGIIPSNPHGIPWRGIGFHGTPWHATDGTMATSTAIATTPPTAPQCLRFRERHPYGGGCCKRGKRLSTRHGRLDALHFSLCGRIFFGRSRPILYIIMLQLMLYLVVPFMNGNGTGRLVLASAAAVNLTII